MWLNLGSGDHPAPAPWVNADTHAALAPDVIADARELPFEDNIATAIYCGHLLEHLSIDEDVPRALAEVYRVLAPGHRACFVGPDYDRAQAFNDDILLGLIRDGGCRWPGDRHLWLSTGPAALRAIKRTFATATEVAIERVSDGWPVVSRVGWQFAITATKEPSVTEQTPAEPEPQPEKREREPKPETRERRMPERAIPYDGNRETR